MKTFYRKYITRFVVCSIVFLPLAACKEEPQKEEEPDTTQIGAVTVLTAAQVRIAGVGFCNVEMRSISGIIQASGRLDVPPQSKVSISAPMGGVVKATEMLQGTHIRKGQAVAVLQHQDYIQLQQEYKEAIGQLEYLKAEYERQEELGKENVNAKKTVQKAKSDFLSLKARVEGLKAKLQLLNVNLEALEAGQIQSAITLYSPIDGYVTKVNVNLGSFVNASDILFEIVNTEHLHAELEIFEKDVPRVKVGQKVLFTLADEARQRVASVYLIGKEIGDDRSIRVHCHLQKEDKDLIPGMYLRAFIETDSAHVTALPDEAIVTYEGNRYIFIEMPGPPDTGGEGSKRFQMVQVGARDTELGFTHVVLPPEVPISARVVCKGAYNLLGQLKNRE